MCYDEEVWQVAAFLFFSTMLWLLGLYFSKSDCNAAFESIARPRFFPSYAAYQTMFLVIASLFSAGAFMAWRDGGGWAGAPIALYLYVASLVIVVISHFITWVFWTHQSVIVGGIVLFFAAAAAVISAVWMFFDAFYWSFAFALLAAVFFAIMGVLTIWLGVYGNSYVIVPGKFCPVPKKNAWVRRPPCPGDGCEVAEVCVNQSGIIEAGNGGGGGRPVAIMRTPSAATPQGGLAGGEQAPGTGVPGEELNSIGLDVSAVQGRNYGLPPRRAESKFTR